MGLRVRREGSEKLKTSCHEAIADDIYKFVSMLVI